MCLVRSKSIFLKFPDLVFWDIDSFIACMTLIAGETDLSTQKVMVDHSHQFQTVFEVLCVGVKYSLHSTLAFNSLPRTKAKGKEHSR